MTDILRIRRIFRGYLRDIFRIFTGYFPDMTDILRISTECFFLEILSSCTQKHISKRWQDTHLWYKRILLGVIIPLRPPASAESRLSGIYRIYHIHFVRYPVPDEMFHIRSVSGAALSAGQIRQMPASGRTCRIVRNMSAAVKRELYKLLPSIFSHTFSSFFLLSFFFFLHYDLPTLLFTIPVFREFHSEACNSFTEISYDVRIIVL